MSKNKNETIEEDILQDLLEISTAALDQELQREIAIKQQASNMQAAFSFVIVAVAMTMPVVIDVRSELSLTFFLISFGCIYIALAISLFFATQAQRYFENSTFKLISEQKDIYKKNVELLVTKKQRLTHRIDLLADIQNSRRITNSKRVSSLEWSMTFFLIGLGLCLFFFVIGVIIVLIY